MTNPEKKNRPKEKILFQSVNLLYDGHPKKRGFKFLFSGAKQEFTVYSLQFTVFSDALHSNALSRRFAPASEH